MISLLRITHMMSERGCVWIQGCPVPADPAHVTCRPSRWNVALTWLRRLHTQTGKCCISEIHVQSVIRCLLVRLSAQLTIGSYLLPTILNLMSIFNSSVKYDGFVAWCFKYCLVLLFLSNIAKLSSKYMSTLLFFLHLLLQLISRV